MQVNNFKQSSNDTWTHPTRKYNFCGDKKLANDFNASRFIRNKKNSFDKYCDNFDVSSYGIITN